MTDEYSADTAVAPPEPSEAPASPPPADTSDERAEELASVAYEQLARDEDISAYAKQREDVDALKDGKELSATEMAEARRRTHRALQDAAEEAAEVNDQVQYEPYREEHHDTELARKTGASAERVNQYIGNDAEKRQHIVDWHQAMDPQSHVATWCIENESPCPGQIMQYTADNPEVLSQIAQLPQRQRDIAIAHLQGMLIAQQQYAEHQSQQYDWQRRNISKAPPPIRSPRGWSSTATGRIPIG
jgi:hypothetical protein